MRARVGPRFSAEDGDVRHLAKRRWPRILAIVWPFLCLVVLEGEVLGWRAEVAEAERLGGTPRDFLSFYTGALLLSQGHGDSLYDLQLQESTQQSLLSAEATDRLHEQVRAQALPFLNPPFVALMFLPLTHLNLPQAYTVWLVANVGFLGALVALLTSSFRYWSRGEHLVAGLTALTFLPAYFAVWQGQISTLLALTVALAWLAFRRGHDGAGGFALALLLAKPQYCVLAFLWLLWRSRWRALGGFGLGVALLGLLALMTAGPVAVLSWVRLLTQAPQLGSYYGAHPDLMFTWSGFLSALTGRAVLTAKEAAPFLIWALLEVTTLSIVAIRRFQPSAIRSSPSFQGAVVLVSSVLVSLHTNVQDLVLLVVAGYLIWDLMRLKERPLVRAMWLAGLLGMHVLVLGLFLLKAAFHAMPYPNMVVVPVLALWLMLLAALTPPFSARPPVPTARSGEAALTP